MSVCKTLRNKRIGITAIDLEQKEHRGIAAVTKSLIEILYKNGAEIFLITSVGSKSFKRGKINKLYNHIYISDALSSLQKGFEYRNEFKRNIKYAFKLKYKLMLSVFNLYKRKFNLKYQIYYLRENDKKKYMYDDRINYIQCIKGLIYIENIFNLCRLRSMRLINKEPELNIIKNELDLIITSCPLSLKRKDSSSTEIVQIIHDAIPLQISTHPENPNIFYNRLLDAHMNSKCIYVSKESKKIVRGFLKFKSHKYKRDSVIHPAPSLNINQLEKALNIKTIRSINKPLILFNSSIVERKKVEKAISYFEKSDLVKRGFLLCIAGKLHDNKYCSYIKKICKDKEYICLLDYVDEVEKAWLFLNASLLISTSYVEGFGVPILDALSLNLPTLASNIPTFKEIKKLNKSNLLELINLNEELTWKDKLNKTKALNINIKELKLIRINHFKHFIDKFENDLISKISSYI